MGNLALGTAPLLLLLASHGASFVQARDVSVCRDATYDLPAARGPICSGSGAAPAGTACPLKGDSATKNCHPLLPSISVNGKGQTSGCVAKENAQCVKISGNVWGCVYPSVGCGQVRVQALDIVCPTWAWDGEGYFKDVVVDLNAVVVHTTTDAWTNALLAADATTSQRDSEAKTDFTNHKSSSSTPDDMRANHRSSKFSPDDISATTIYYFSPSSRHVCSTPRNPDRFTDGNTNCTSTTMFYEATVLYEATDSPATNTANYRSKLHEIFHAGTPKEFIITPESHCLSRALQSRSAAETARARKAWNGH